MGANQNLEKRQSSWKKWIGLGLIGLSGIWFAFIFIVEFLGFSLAIRAVLSTVFFFLMEGTFYLGLFLVGKQLLSRYWRSFRIRFRF
ncbi:MAG: hypothetical protein ABSE82_01655 [Nitrososphaerales archaeon]